MLAGTLSPSFARRATSIALFSVTLASIGLAAPLLSRHAAAQIPARIQVEAEDYVQPYDYGGQPISLMKADSTASCYTSVWGLDHQGDWIELNVHVPHSMFLRDSVRSCGDTGVRRKWVVTWELGLNESAWVSDTLPTTPVGAGIT